MSRATDVDATWQYIAQGIDIIMVKDLREGGLTPEVYMKMYTTIHNHCVASNSSSALPPSAQGRTSRAAGSTVGSVATATSFRNHHTKLNGGDLYEKLSECLKQYLQQILDDAPKRASGTDDTPDEGMELIQYYNRCWQRYTTGATYLDHIFSYLNRHWVKQERDEGGRQRGVYDINTLCLALWRDNLFMVLKPRLLDALLAQIERHRDGFEVNQSELKSCIKSMVSFGVDDNNAKRTNLLFYSRHFETDFIKATAQYYERESSRYIAEHGVVPYMRRVAERLREEKLRVDMYLHTNTEDLLIGECERLLIEAHQRAIQGEFLRLLAADRTDDVHILYTLLGKVSMGLDPIKSKLKDHVEQVGLNAVDELVSEIQPAQDPKMVEPRAYIETLLKVYNRFDKLVNEAFDGSAEMRKAVDLGCETVINRNSVARPPGGSSESRTPELLARFSDSMLKKSRNTQDFAEIDKGLDGIIRVLRFVEEKDAFEKHYSRMLSRRLVHQTSANQDLETAMVTKLGRLYGFEYTNKLQRMFQDMTTSQELRTRYRDNTSSEDTAVSSFAPLVLAEGFWPLPYRDVSFNMPRELGPALQGFEAYYYSIHSGRKLRWLWNFSKGELKVNFAQSMHILQVSIFQMAILLAFNELDSDTLSKDTLLEHTKLPSDVFEGSIAYIIKAQVLLEDTEASTYTINRQLKSRRVRINLNLPLKSEVRQEAREVDRQLSDDRRMFLQAVMVRIMKARRSITHEQLLQETVQQASKRFQPSVRDIKRCITSLVEKEYIQRVGVDTLVYLA